MIFQQFRQHAFGYCQRFAACAVYYFHPLPLESVGLRYRETGCRQIERYLIGRFGWVGTARLLHLRGKHTYAPVSVL